MASATEVITPNIGRVTQIIGSTFDAEFAEDKLPAIYNALLIESEHKGVSLRLTGEVQQHLGGGRVRCVALGSTVVVEDARGRSHTYMVVDSAETNPSQGKVSDESPVGRALLGAAPGDVVTVHAPAGTQRLTVKELR